MGWLGKWEAKQLKLNMCPIKVECNEIRKLVEDYVQKECSCKVSQMFLKINKDWIVNRKKTSLTF